MVANPINNTAIPRFRIAMAPEGDTEEDVVGVEEVLGQKQEQDKLLA